MEAYKTTPVLFPVDITEDVVELVAKKLSGSAGPGDTHLDALQGWLLKFGYYKKNFVLVLNILWYGWPIRTHYGPPIGCVCLAA